MVILSDHGHPYIIFCADRVDVLLTMVFVMLRCLNKDLDFFYLSRIWMFSGNASKYVLLAS